MEDNISTTLDMSIGAGTNITGSEVGVVHNNYNVYDPFLNYIKAKESIYNDLNDFETIDSKYTNSFQILDDIDKYILNNRQLFQSTMDQICCDKRNEATSSQIRKFLIFCIKAIIADSSNTNKLSKITISNREHWLFSPHGYDDISIDIAMAKILSYFSRHKDCDIKGGVCIVSNISQNGMLNCKFCKDGALNVVEDFNILSDFMITNQPIKFNDDKMQEDYFQIHKSRNLIFKCGNCLTNIGRFEESQRVLKGVKIL